MNSKLIIAAGLLLAIPAINLYAQDADQNSQTATTAAKNAKTMHHGRQGEWTANKRGEENNRVSNNREWSRRRHNRHSCGGRGGEWSGRHWGGENGMSWRMGGWESGRQNRYGEGSFSRDEMTRKTDSLLADVRKSDAALADTLDNMRKEKPMEFRMAMASAMPAMLYSGKSGDKTAVVAALNTFVLETEVRALAMQYRKGDGDKADVKKQLEAKISSLFDAKLAMEQNRAEALAKAASDMKDNLAKRKADKAELVKSRLSEMTTERKDW